jgi:hypothetical protein
MIKPKKNSLSGQNGKLMKYQTNKKQYVAKWTKWQVDELAN